MSHTPSDQSQQSDDPTLAGSREALVMNSDETIAPREAQILCDFIVQTAQLDPHRKPGQQLAPLVCSAFSLELVAIFDADLRESYWSGETPENVEDVLQNICVFETSDEDAETGLVRRVLRMGRLPIGALLLRGEINGLVASALASVLAISFDRYHAFANESRTESARRIEQMRAMVLDNLAHAYKTPLTAIEAASSGLAAMGHLTPTQAELVNLIEEQADQLSQLTTRLLKTAQLEASDLVPHATQVAIAPLIDDVMSSLRQQLAAFSFTVRLSRSGLSLFCDRHLVLALLTHYVENATKYAEPGTEIMLQVIEKLNAVVFSVRSFGAVIPERDRERIFDRFFRSSIHVGSVQSTGIGLSVAKRAAQAHGGHVWVTTDATQGTIFYASFPIAERTAPK
jgi:two-component system sensor histidine kinase KdpD